MVQLQARQFTLAPPHHHHLHYSPTTTTSLLVDPTSVSLALMHSDSSISLYPSLSPLSPSPAPLRTLTILPPSSAATFLTLRQNTSSAPRVVFIVSSPLLGGSAVLLRFFILNSSSNSFSKSRVVCNQSDLAFDQNKCGVVFRTNHGVSVKLVGSINLFAMSLISNAKIYLFAVKMAGDDDVDGATTVKLMKCAVIDCSLPVFSISVSLGFLILGEHGGARVFPLRPLVKGRVKKRGDHRGINHKDLNSALDSDNQLHLSNGNGSGDVRGNAMVPANGVVSSCGNHSDSAKLKSVKLRQDSREGGGCFVPFKSNENNNKEVSMKSVKAISIQVLSPNKFLILDSVGDLHLLCLSNPVFGSEIPCQMKKFTLSMKVQYLAVLPDISTRAQTVWISDGDHTVHTMTLSDVDPSAESGVMDFKEKLIESTVVQAIFTSEKIQQVIPFAANAILILGQANSIFAYAIS